MRTMTINNITFLETIIPNNMFCSANAVITRFYFTDALEVRKFLESLEIDTVYVVTFDFVYSWLAHDDDCPLITLTKPILLTKNSNPLLIYNYLQTRIGKACDAYFLDEEMIDKLDKKNIYKPLVK
jgi:hypothetical protein